MIQQPVALADCTQEQIDALSHDEIADWLRRYPHPLLKAAADSIAYLAAQEGLLEKAQQAAERAHAELAETKRPLDEQMARLNQRVVELNADAERLDFLDRTNARFRMGWKVGKAPAGNVSVQSVIHAVGRVVGIREAIDAARGATTCRAEPRASGEWVCDCTQMRPDCKPKDGVNPSHGSHSA